jgi:group I intron endonuclease
MIYNNTDLDKERIILDNYKIAVLASSFIKKYFFFKTAGRSPASVYKWLNNLSGKLYIGSSINLSNPLRLYYNYDYISDNSKGNSIIHQALNNYGYSNFTLEIMKYCDADKVVELEQHYFDTLNPEYNILKTAGNSLGFKHSEETKLKISATRLGYKHSEETKLKFKNV